jgi:hypothetical protein
MSEQGAPDIVPLEQPRDNLTFLGDQTYVESTESTTRREFPLEAQTRLVMQQELQKHELSEKAKDNELLREQKKEQLKRDARVFHVAIGGGAVVGVICLGIIILSPNPTQQQWAQTVISALIGAVAGYFTGKNHTGQNSGP